MGVYLFMKRSRNIEYLKCICRHNFVWNCFPHYSMPRTFRHTILRSESFHTLIMNLLLRAVLFFHTLIRIELKCICRHKFVRNRFPYYSKPKIVWHAILRSESFDMLIINLFLRAVLFFHNLIPTATNQTPICLD